VNAWPRRSIATSRGFSLLEVLIASTIFSLGMSGLSALLLFNLSSSAQSRNASTACSAAANLAEQIHLNPLAIDRYLNPPGSISRSCQSSTVGSGPAMCSPPQQADYDYSNWQIELAEQIRNSTAVVCKDSSPEDGDRNHYQCDGDGSIVIKIFWGGPANSANQTASEYRYTLVSS